jgi:hypothetical protein
MVWLLEIDKYASAAILRAANLFPTRILIINFVKKLCVCKNAFSRFCGANLPQKELNGLRLVKIYRETYQK